MANTEHTTEGERPGLTKPLVNNVGGVIDQDAPSADQLLKGQPDPAWGDTPLQEGVGGVGPEDRGGLIPDVRLGMGSPAED